MGRKYSRRTVLAGSAAGLATLSGCGLLDPQTQPADTPPGAGEASGTVKFGVLAPQSGPMERYGSDIVDAVKLAERQVIASRNGFGVDVSIKDTEGDPDTAASRAQELSDAGYAAIVGPATMESTRKVMNQVLKPNSIIANTPFAARGQSTMNDNGLVWGTAPGTVNVATGLTRIVALGRIEDAAVIHSKNHYGRKIAESVAQQLGDRRVDIIKQVGIEPGADSYSDKVDEAMADDPAGAIIVGGAPGIQALKDFTASYGSKNVFLSDRLKRAELPSEIEASLENATVTSARPSWHTQKLRSTEPGTSTYFTATPTATGEDADLLTRFVDAFQIAYDRFPSIHAAQAFDATTTLMLGMVRTTTDPESDRYTGEQIKQNMVQVSNQQASIPDVRSFGNGDYWEGFGQISQGIYNTYIGPSSGVEYDDQTGFVRAPEMHGATFAPDAESGFEETIPIPT